MTPGELAWKWLLRLAGLTGIGYETIYAQADRPWLLLLFGGMVGLAQLGPLQEKLLGDSSASTSTATTGSSEAKPK